MCASSEITDSQRLDWMLKHPSVTFSEDDGGLYAMAILDPGGEAFVLGNYIARGETHRACIDRFILGEVTRVNYALAAYHGRQNDVLVINPGNPEFSNTYNPEQGLCRLVPL